jgi:hypothetical protein
VPRPAASEDLRRRAEGLLELADRLQHVEDGKVTYTPQEVEEIVRHRVERARDTWRQIIRERDELAAEVAELRRQAIGTGTPLRGAAGGAAD